MLSQDRYQISDFVISDNNEELYKLKILREVMRFFEQVFVSTLKQPEMVELMYEYELHVLLFVCASQDYSMVKYFIDLNKYFSFIDNDILFALNDLLSSKDNIPNLSIFFSKAHKVLEKKYDINLDENGSFPLTINNFQIQNDAMLGKMKELFGSLMKYDINQIIEAHKLKKFEQEYDYKILNDGISINAPAIFRIFFKALRNDVESIGDIVSIVAPLLRDIPGGVVIFNIISNLTKSDISKVISIMPNLVRIMMISKLNLDLNMSTYEIEEKLKQLNFNEAMIEGVVAWISSIVVLINKNISQFDIRYYRKIFERMMSTLENYEKEIGSVSKIVKNAMKQADFILMILGF